MKKNTENTEVTGTITDLYCQRPTFCAGKFNVNHRTKRFRVKGYVESGRTVTMLGKWVNDPKWGEQFEADDVIYTMPVDEKGMRHWLSWSITGVGPVTANKLMDEFGKDLPRLCIEDPGQVAATCGVAIETVMIVANAWQKSANDITVKSKLAGWGLTKFQTDKIADKFKGSAIDLILANPYMLLGEVDGLGFAKVDEIALKVGVSRSDHRRLAAAVQWSVKGGYREEGHTCMTQEAALAAAEKMLAGEVIDAGMLDELIEAGKIVKYKSNGGDVWYSVAVAASHEKRIWDYFKNQRERKPMQLASKLNEGDSVAVGEFTLDETQSAAVLAAQNNRVSVVTGGAGSGKTLVARAIYEHFTRGGRSVYLVAPTGKAARRLSEVIGCGTGNRHIDKQKYAESLRNGSDLSFALEVSTISIDPGAMTIHRTLGFNPDGTFSHDESNPLPKGLYIVDEFSMVSSYLMSSLVRAMPADAEMVLIGDENQLPAVGPGAILRDVIAHGLAAVTRLEKCHRQAGVLKRNCAAIIEGEVAENDESGNPPAWLIAKSATTPESVIKLMTRLFESKFSEWGFDFLKDCQFMTAVHKGKLGTKRLNRYVQWLNQNRLGNVMPEPDPNDERRAILLPGDKVIHTKNNYQLNVMNGTIGYVISTNPLTVEYEDATIEYPPGEEEQVELGYVLTPHKMQGSEIPVAVTIMPKNHFFMQTKNWFYTAVTRAKRMSIVIGDGDSIKRASVTSGGNTRMTLLSVWATNPETAGV